MIMKPDGLREPSARLSTRTTSRVFLSLLAPVVGAAALFSVFTSSATAQVAYNETIMGDLSNSGLAPTAITLHPGSNEIMGTTGRTGATIDRDYFTVTIPSHFTLNSIIELPATSVGGASSFIGLQAGNQVTLSTSAATATGLLGWTHYSADEAGTDIFPLMSIASNGSSGFMIPLSEGSYSFWIQDFNAGSFAYGFDLQVAAAVPEPSTYGMIGAGVVLLLAARRRFSKKATTSDVAA